MFLNLSNVIPFCDRTSTPVLLTPSIAILIEYLAAALGDISFDCRALKTLVNLFCLSL